MEPVIQELVMQEIEESKNYYIGSSGGNRRARADLGP
jgi:hypothetical protein